MSTGGVLHIVTNIALLALLVVLILLPEGPVRTYFADRRAFLEQAERIQILWDGMTEYASPLNGDLVSTAEIDIIMFGDYRCGFCQTSHDELKELLRRHPDVRVGYIQFPLDTAGPSDYASRLALCGEEDGVFRAVHDRLYEWEDWRTQPDWILIANDAGVEDIDRFETCLTNKRTHRRLRQHASFGQTLDIPGTPTFVSLSGIHVGLGTVDDLIALIDGP